MYRQCEPDEISHRSPHLGRTCISSQSMEGGVGNHTTAGCVSNNNEANVGLDAQILQILRPPERQARDWPSKSADFAQPFLPEHRT